VLAIGCFDSSGRTGLIRDYLAARALGATAILVPTTLAIQSADGLRIEGRELTRVLADIEAALPAVTAIKVGLLGSTELIAPLTKLLARVHGAVVYDPVLVDPAGGPLVEAKLETLQPLLAQVTLVTTDVAEASQLTGQSVGDYDSARLAATYLRGRGAAAVLIKGATLPNESVDVLAQDEGEAHFGVRRRESALPHGTGDAMATAIAVGLTRRLSVRGSVREAHRWLHAQVDAAEAADSPDWL
jgi:hydroxymethylpyrimidine kinase/phosphomethylpyrimidine kinase